MLAHRSAGILMHVTSLPSRGGIGDLGPAADEFVNWLAAARQTLWQVLPLGPLGHGNSPYSCTSAFAGNVLLISLERLADRGLIDRERVEAVPDGDCPVGYESVRAHKLPLLREAARNFLLSASRAARKRYQDFCRQNKWWLEDYVLFSALRERFGDQPWNNWPPEIVRRDPETIAKMRKQLHEKLEQERFLQFAFFEQWRALRSRCREVGVRVIGDLAIFVSYDSADVWTHPEIFRLKDDLSPEVVAGVPPDVFSETGQRWGNPLYDWDALKAHGYDWWIKRMRWAVETCDIVRLDHFRGFEAYWEIPADEPTAIHGRWVQGPNEDLFKALQDALGDLPFIAEDLGYITPAVTELRRKLGIPGTKVMQFGFGDRGARKYLPHRFKHNSVVYTGTHDNDTTVGWWNSSATEDEKKRATAYLGISCDGVNWAFTRAALTSVANLAVIQVQDVLGLGSDARMNVPSQQLGSWVWRLRPGALTPELAAKLATLVEVTDRDATLQQPSTVTEQENKEANEDFVV
jgi:4-alpha-glucanotransferase